MPVARNLQRWLAFALILVVVGSVVAWWRTQERLPQHLRIATARPGGLYHEVARVIGEVLEARTGCTVELRSTKGSVENAALLQRGEVDLAILQATALQGPGELNLHELGVLAPLYPDVLHVVVRRGRGIESIEDLLGREILIGPEGSGMRVSAQHLIDHYHVEPGELRVYRLG